MSRNEPVAVTTILGLGRLGRSACEEPVGDRPGREEPLLTEARTEATRPEARTRKRWKPVRILVPGAR